MGRRTPRAAAGEAPPSAAPRVPRPGPRGWVGRGRGSSTYVQAADEWRGTTVQMCGLWPFAAGTGSPMIGVPLGRNLLSGATLCCDPISWFQRAKLISNPSAFVLGKPGLGKSTVVRRMALGLVKHLSAELEVPSADRKALDAAKTVTALRAALDAIGCDVGRGRALSRRFSTVALGACPPVCVDHVGRGLSRSLTSSSGRDGVNEPK